MRVSGSGHPSMVQPETHVFEDGRGIPNSRLPVLIYHDVQEAREAPECEVLFDRNGWRGAWLDGIFSFHHFHSTAHEVLGIVAGSGAVILGGPDGRRFEIRRGDVFVLPAYRGRGLATWLTETVVGHPDLQVQRSFVLATRDAHGLYGKFGWTPAEAGRFIRITRPYRMAE